MSRNLRDTTLEWATLAPKDFSLDSRRARLVTAPHSSRYLADLVRELCALAHEIEWVEFKENYRSPESMGRYISALANSAVLHGKSHGYVLWGVKNGTHELVGTNFVPGSKKKGNELIEPWLARLLEPQVSFRFEELEVDGSRVVLLEVERATSRPVAFQGTEFIRIGSSTRKLRDHPTREKQLWRLFLNYAFEDGTAAEHLTGQDILQALDYSAYFHMLGVPLPDGRNAILEALAHDELINPNQAGGYDITNLGAILFARRLAKFPGLKRKAVRLIRYRGSGRMDAEREQEGGKGYAIGFEGLVGHIRAWTPSNEVLGPAFRREIPMFPPGCDPRTRRQCPDPPGLHDDRRRADDRDIRPSLGDQQSRRAADRHEALSGHAAPFSERKACVAYAPPEHLRGAGHRHRQGRCRRGKLRTSGTRIREATGIHEGFAVRP